MKYMKTMFAIAVIGACGQAMAQQQDPTPRKGMDPVDQAKVSQVQAKRWIGYGANQQVQQVTQTSGMNGPLSPKACITNIGTTTSPTGAAGFTPRYGPASTDPSKGRVVVVKGDVINVCK